MSSVSASAPTGWLIGSPRPGFCSSSTGTVWTSLNLVFRLLQQPTPGTQHSRSLFIWERNPTSGEPSLSGSIVTDNRCNPDCILANLVIFYCVRRRGLRAFSSSPDTEFQLVRHQQLSVAVQMLTTWCQETYQTGNMKFYLPRNIYAGMTIFSFFFPLRIFFFFCNIPLSY